MRHNCGNKFVMFCSALVESGGYWLDVSNTKPDTGLLAGLGKRVWLWLPSLLTVRNIVRAPLEMVMKINYLYFSSSPLTGHRLSRASRSTWTGHFLRLKLWLMFSWYSGFISLSRKSYFSVMCTNRPPVIWHYGSWLIIKISSWFKKDNLDRRDAGVYQD